MAFGTRSIFSNGGGTVTSIVAVIATGTAITAGVVSGSFDSPDASAPSLFLTAPADGATVSGSSVTVSATCGDNVACAGVQFKLNGANLNAEDTSAPFSTTWDSSASGNGTYTLTAVGRDAALNQRTSNSETVTVTGGSGGGPPVANVWMDSAGSDVGANCPRSATPIAEQSASTVCLSPGKSVHERERGRHDRCRVRRLHRVRCEQHLVYRHRHENQ